VVTVRAEAWLNAIGVMVVLLFLGGVVAVGPPAQWPAAVQIPFIALVVTYGVVRLSRRVQRH
jgi:hypothetical protein